MAKHVVLDAIARSGTTLMSALLRSQEKSMAFCPGFNEPLSCKDIGEWPHGICRQDFLNSPEIDFQKFQNESYSQIVDYAQYYGLSQEEWSSIIYDASNTSEIRKNIEKAFPDIEIFCYRWNQSLCYFHEWIKNGEDFLWLSMIRHPLDRAVSSFEKHHWQFEESLKNTLCFAEKLQAIKDHPQFHLVYYEDLVDSPEQIMQSVYSFFGAPSLDINLESIKGSNGEDFIPQSSMIVNVSEKKDGYLTDAKKYNGLYKKGVDRYKKAAYFDTDGTKKPMMNVETHEVFANMLDKYPEYNRYFK